MKTKLLFIIMVSLMVFLFACNKEDKDEIAPIITLLGNNPLHVDKNSTYADPGYSAIDETDGDITTKVTVSGTVDTSVEGTYTLTYQVEDAAGNAAASQQRQIIVIMF
jgi:major membrane immunogen (membrane-anchored lipoprotein)